MDGGNFSFHKVSEMTVRDAPVSNSMGTGTPLISKGIMMDGSGVVCPILNI